MHEELLNMISAGATKEEALEYCDKYAETAQRLADKFQKMADMARKTRAAVEETNFDG